MRFSRTSDESERAKVATDFGHTVIRLIASEHWQEMPGFEDMLTDERMPDAFFRFWSIPSARTTNEG
jgi:hypothetical protein